jgi:hypothetical protein
MSPRLLQWGEGKARDCRWDDERETEGLLAVPGEFDKRNGWVVELVQDENGITTEDGDAEAKQDKMLGSPLMAPVPSDWGGDDNAEARAALVAR